MRCFYLHLLLVPFQYSLNTEHHYEYILRQKVSEDFIVLSNKPGCAAAHYKPISSLFHSLSANGYSPTQVHSSDFPRTPIHQLHIYESTGLRVVQTITTNILSSTYPH